jgi:hypothetical protein
VHDAAYAPLPRLGWRVRIPSPSPVYHCNISDLYQDSRHMTRHPLS